MKPLAFLLYINRTLIETITITHVAHFSLQFIIYIYIIHFLIKKNKKKTKIPFWMKVSQFVLVSNFLFFFSFASDFLCFFLNMRMGWGGKERKRSKMSGRDSGTSSGQLLLFSMHAVLWWTWEYSCGGTCRFICKLAFKISKDTFQTPDWTPVSPSHSPDIRKL